MDKVETDLSNLHDIVTPDPVGFWPLAMGWWVLLFLAVCTALYFGWRRWKSWKENAYRRSALEELENVEDAGEVLALVRRVALAWESREVVAGLQGAAWVEWLGRHYPGEISGQVGELISRAAYAGQSDGLGELKQFATNWIRGHVRPC